MRVRDVVLAAVAMGLASDGFACRTRPQRARAIEAHLELAAGEVTVGAPDDLHTARTGAVIPPDGQLVTGAGARALARLADGSAIVLRADTAVTLAGADVALDHGQLFVDASAGEGRTPARFSVGEHRITAERAAFFVERDESGGGRVVVTRGRVALSGPSGRVEVGAGERAALGADAPKVEPVAYFEDWTGGMADHAADGAGTGAGRVYGVGDGVARPLDIQRQDVRAVVRAGMMETRVDQTFFNPTPRDLEGWYWFRLPEGAMVTGYAVEFGGQMVDGAFVERTRAVAAYGAAASAGLDPSLLEWVDAQTVRAKIDPIPAMGTRRVSLVYLQRLDAADGVLRISYPMRSNDPPRIGEFALTVDLGDEGKRMALSTLEDARVEDGGAVVTVRRTDFVPRTDFVLEARQAEAPPPMRVSRFSAGGDTADYVMVRFRPDVDWEAVGPQTADLVVLVDTSAGIDQATRQLQAATVEAVLRSLSGADRFAVVAVDVDATVLHPAAGLAPASEESTSAALERLSEHGHGGATDLSAAFPVALGLLHDAVQPAIVYVGDGNATTGELGGERLREDLRTALSASRTRFFALGVGPDTNQALLGELARAGGGRAWAVDAQDQATERALWLAADVKTPTLTDLAVDLGAGVDALFDTSGGKVSAGEEVVLVGRTHHPLPDKIVVTGSLGGSAVAFTETPVDDDPLIASFAPKLWAQASIQRRLGSADRPDELWGQVAREGIAYGLLTPYSSVLVLEDEAAYQRMGVPRGPRPLSGVHLVDLSPSTPAGLAFGCGAAAPRQEEQLYAEPSYRGAPASQPAPSPIADGDLATDDGPPPPPPPPPADPGVAGGEDAGQVRSEVQLGKAAEAPELDANRRSLGALDRQKNEADETEQGWDAKTDAAGRAFGGLVAARGRGERDAGKRSADDHLRDVDARQRPKVASPPNEPCSDASTRPLADRTALWGRSLAAGGDPWSVYGRARARCEIGDWAAQSRLIDQMAASTVDADTAQRVLTGLADADDDAARERYAGALLRRTSQAAMVDAILGALGADPVGLAGLEAELTRASDPTATLAKVRAAADAAPNDPRGARLLVRALAAAGRYDELRITVQRLRERGVLSPLVAREVGDALAAAGDQADAIRTYSEIVEFDPASPDARLALGDVLLAHAWYDAAYRQYTTLVERDGGARAQVRQAIAAAGAGRTYEALQVLGAVAASPSREADGGPGQWAELWAAAITARILEAAPEPGASLDSERDADSLRRRLKALPFFRAPAELIVVTWDDLGARLALAVDGQRYDGADVGVLAAVRPIGSAGAPVITRVGAGGGAGGAPIAARVHRIRWDGARFEVHTEALSVGAPQG